MGLVPVRQWEKSIIINSKSMSKFLLQINNQKKYTIHYGFGFGKKHQTPSVDPHWREKKVKVLYQRFVRKYVFVSFLFEYLICAHHFHAPLLLQLFWRTDQLLIFISFTYFFPLYLLVCLLCARHYNRGCEIKEKGFSPPKSQNLMGRRNANKQPIILSISKF